MAKQQSFADKASKKKGKSLGTFVKYIKSVLSEKTGHWRFNEQIVNIKDGENLVEEEKQALDIEMPTDNVEAAPAEEEAPAEKEQKKTKNSDSNTNES